MSHSVAENLRFVRKRHEQLGQQRRSCMGWFVVALAMTLGSVAMAQFLPDLVPGEDVNIRLRPLGAMSFKTQHLQLAFCVVSVIFLASAISFFLRRRILSNQTTELLEKIANLELELNPVPEASEGLQPGPSDEACALDSPSPDC